MRDLLFRKQTGKEKKQQTNWLNTNISSARNIILRSESMLYHSYFCALKMKRVRQIVQSSQTWLCKWSMCVTGGGAYKSNSIVKCAYFYILREHVAEREQVWIHKTILKRFWPIKSVSAQRANKFYIRNHPTITNKYAKVSKIGFPKSSTMSISRNLILKRVFLLLSIVFFGLRLFIVDPAAFLPSATKEKTFSSQYDDVKAKNAFDFGNAHNPITTYNKYNWQAQARKWRIDTGKECLINDDVKNSQI